jgi:hypothetical protein
MSESKPNWSRLILLGGLAAGLSGVAFWVAKNKPKEDAKKEEAKKIFALSSTGEKGAETQIKSVSLIGEKPLRIECQELAEKKCKPGDSAKWSIHVPGKFKADDSNANSLVSSLNNLLPTDTIDLKEETPEKRSLLLKEYGLDATTRNQASTRRVEVETSTGTTVMVLGGTHPIGDNIFVGVERIPAGGKPSGKIDENSVYLIASYFKSNFEKDLTHWRDKKVLSLSAHEVVEFKLKTAKDELTGSRKEGVWDLLTPRGEKYSGDPENIDNLITGTTYLMAKGFAAEDSQSEAAKKTLKGAKPVLNLSLKIDRPKASEKASQPLGQPSSRPSSQPSNSAEASSHWVTLQFWQVGGTSTSVAPKSKKPTAPKPATSGGKLYLTISTTPTVFELESNSKDRFEKGLKHLRMTKLITSMDRFGARKLEFSSSSTSGKVEALTQKDGKWLNADSKEINGEKIISLLDRLSGNRVKDFLTGPSAPSGATGALQLSVFDEKGTVKRKFSFWTKGDQLYALDLLSGRKEVLLLDNVLKDSLPLNSPIAAFYKKDEPKPSPTTPSPVKK